MVLTVLTLISFVCLIGGRLNDNSHLRTLVTKDSAQGNNMHIPSVEPETTRRILQGDYRNNANELAAQFGPVIVAIFVLFFICCCWSCIRDIICAIMFCEICEYLLGE